jgi:hypothetical protein
MQLLEGQDCFGKNNRTVKRLVRNKNAPVRGGRVRRPGGEKIKRFKVWWNRPEDFP